MADICQWGDNTRHLVCTEEATATWRGDPYCALHKAYFEHADVCAEDGCDNPTNYVEFDAHYRCTDGGTDTRCARHLRPEVRAELEVCA